MSKIEKNILLILKILTFLIPFSLILVCPRYFCPFNLFFPYITGKAIFFRILVEISFALILILLLRNLQYLPKKEEYIFWSSILLAIVLLLTVPFSIRPYLSFWGNAERMEGYWGLIHFFMWFWVLYILFKIVPNFKKTIFYSFLIVLYIVSLIEISQRLQGTIRPDSTFGNPTYVGFFSVLIFFLCLYFLKNSTKFEKPFIFMGIIFSLLNIIISATRGSLLALLIALPTSLLYYFLSSKTKLLTKIIVSLSIFIFLLFFFLLINSQYAQYLGILKRTYDTLRNPATYMARWLAWGIFLNAWKERPIFGYGLENSPIAYFKSFNPEIFNYEEVIFDRPHNKYIEILATTGIFGAIFWLIFFASIFHSIFRNLTNNYEKAVLLGLFLGYLGQNLTLFDIQASYLPFFFGLSLLSPLYAFEKKKVIQNISLKILIFSLLFFGIFINLFHFYIVREIINAIHAPYPLGLHKFKHLISFNTNFIPEIATMAHRYLETNIARVENLSEANDFTEIYYRAFKKDPYDPRIQNMLILHLSRLINAKKISNLDYSFEYNLVLYIYGTYLKIYPNYLDLKLDYAKFLQSMGEYEKALRVLEEIRTIYRESPRVYFLLANLYYLLNKKDIALSLIKETISRGHKPQNQIQYLIVLRILKDTSPGWFKEVLNEYQKNFPGTSSIEILEKVLKETSN